MKGMKGVGRQSGRPYRRGLHPGGLGWAGSGRWRLVIGAIALILLLGAGPYRVWAQPPGETVTVDYAPSGQSLALLYPLSAPSPVDRIRLAGITAPDPQQVPWGEVAQTCLNDQVRNQLVRVEPSDPDVDAYGRLWAYVWRGDRAVNATLLAEGCAYLDTDHLPQNPYADAWIYAQEEGRLLGRGIWDPAQPLRQTPEAFRQSQPAAAPASSP